MEVDFIFLPKSSEINKTTIEEEFNNILSILFQNVKCSSFIVDTYDGKKYEIKYKYKISDDKIVYFKVEFYSSEMICANVLDCVISKIISGEHRKNYHIIQAYDETSLVYCKKLMPLFVEFEKKLRHLLYETFVKTFQSSWIDKCFNEEILNELKSKISKNKMIEGILDELDYEHLKKVLFDKISRKDIAIVLDEKLSEENLKTLSKMEIVEYLNSCRKFSLWDKLFSEYDDLLNIKEDIDYLQPYRNKVMHSKNINRQQFLEVRRRLKNINKKINLAILKLENIIYNDDDIVDIVLSVSNVSNVSKSIEKSFLSLAKTINESIGFMLKTDYFKTTLNETFKKFFETLTNCTQNFTQNESEESDNKNV